MSSFDRLIDALQRHTGRDAPLGALATVTAVEGSNFRRPGARMVIAEDGARFGVISGGCLEQDISQRLRAAVAGAEPISIRYDSTSPQEIVMGLGLGCDGIVDILLEPLAAAGGVLADLSRRLGSGEPVALATIVGTQIPGELGRHLLRGQDGTLVGDLGDPALNRTAEIQLQQLPPGRIVHRMLDADEGQRGVLLESIQPPPALLVFGASAVAGAINEQTRQLGWRMTVADFRPAMLGEAEYPGARTTLVQPEQLATELPGCGAAAVLICTHNYLRDLEALRAVLAVEPDYIGVVGSRARAQRMQGELDDSCNQERLYSPAGLDIGAETPEEIAVSIIAEIRAALAGRDGGHLRSTRGPIHPR